MTAKCAICNSTFNLLFSCDPKTIGQSNDIKCERCFAKIYFKSEYPNLSYHAIQHIRSLPHLCQIRTNPGINISSQFHPSTQIYGFGKPSINPIPNYLQMPNISTSATTMTSQQVPKFGIPGLSENNTKIKTDTECLIDARQILNQMNKVNTLLPSLEDEVPGMTDKTNSTNPNRNENAKKLNEFIKKALFPEIMEFPDLEPNTKNAKMDTSSAETEDEKEDQSDWPFEWIGGDVKSIRDLIRIGREYKTNPKRVQTNLDMDKLVRLIEPLETLQNMVGLEDIKDSIFKQVVFHLQDLDNGNKDMHHTVIKGPPGVGKTQISHIIAKIYKGLGFLKKDTVVSVKRDDLIAGYLGQTAMKAKKKYEEALGGVLLIDEAYALGDGSDKDIYSKEAIDLLTSYLSEHGHEFICIIAGYKEALEKRFFSVNEGLARRFNIHYDIKPYSGDDICQIFQKLVADGGWQLDASANNPEFFVANIDAFPHFGGDMLNLFAYTKKAHSTRLLSIRTKEQLMNTKKKINMADLEAGFEQYKSGNGYAKKDTPFEAKFMYM
jgi:DNA polymerase III delta prime subunit/DNA-directed RNA polymerase subunit RPC12/RpoP